MIITYNDEQMLGLWRQGAGLEPALSDASLERFNAFGINGRLRTAMRAWYINYLAEYPIEKVPVTDLTRYVRLTPGPAKDQWTLKVVCECARIVSIDVEKRGRLQMLNPTDKDNSQSYGLLNRFRRRGPHLTAFYEPGTDTAILNIASKTEPQISMVTGVLITEDDQYRVDERVLEDIPPLAKAVLSGY